MLKRSASHAFVTLVLCLATDANAIFSALPSGCFGKSAADISRALSPIAINLSASCSQCVLLIALPLLIRTEPSLLTMEGQYIVKNLVIIGAALVLGGQLQLARTK